MGDLTTPHDIAKEFLNDTNSTPRRLGHNKLQDTIDQLEIQLKKQELAHTEQEMKLGLYKKTIASLQAQIADQSSIIAELKSAPALIEPTATTNDNYDILLEDSLQKCSLLEQENQKYKQALATQEQQHNTSSQMVSDELQRLKTAFDNQTREFNECKEKFQLLSQELTQAQNVANASATERDTLRHELAISNQKYLEQTQELQESHNELQKQLVQAREIIIEPVPQISGHARRKVPRGEPKKRR